MITSMWLGICLDWLFGEVKRFHPLVGFGRYADWLEATLNKNGRLYFRGAIAWGLAVVPIAGAVWVFQWQLADYFWAEIIFSGVCLYACIGAKSLRQHAMAIFTPLMEGDLQEARTKVGWIVSRDCQQLSAEEVAKAGTESILENGNDAVFAALFWFVVLGPTGAVVFRLANTLDAMWGYRTPRFAKFGWAAAKLDDALNWLPARLTAFTYAVLGQFSSAVHAWKNQAKHWKSSNAGAVMASGAGALGVSLGGEACYQGELQKRPVLGCEENKQTKVSANTLRQALLLVEKGLLLWAGIITLVYWGYINLG